MAVIHLLPVSLLAHPLHSQAIERPCALYQQGNDASLIAGRCSFFVASGYLVFQLNVPPGAEYATSKIFSGTINMAQSTGSVFLAGGEELARGEVILAGRSLQLVHGEPGTLAAWPNGYVLEVGGSPAGTP